MKERNLKDIAKIQMNVIFIFVVGLFIDVIYKFFILKRPFNDFMISTITLIVAMFYLGFTLYKNGILTRHRKEGEIKFDFLKESFLIGIFISTITYALSEEGFDTLYPKDPRISFVITFALEIVIVTIIVYFFKLLTGKIIKKIISNKHYK